MSAHVNELLIRNESESQGGSLTDRVEELLKGVQLLSVYPSTALIYLCVCVQFTCIYMCLCFKFYLLCSVSAFLPRVGQARGGLV